MLICVLKPLFNVLRWRCFCASLALFNILWSYFILEFDLLLFVSSGFMIVGGGIWCSFFFGFLFEDIFVGRELYMLCEWIVFLSSLFFFLCFVMDKFVSRKVGRWVGVLIRLEHLFRSLDRWCLEGECISWLFGDFVIVGYRCHR